MKKLPSVTHESVYVTLTGGDDLVTPTINVSPGKTLLTQNYEINSQGRYQLINGYEAFDGRPKPSEASYWLLNFDAGLVEIIVEDIVYGATGIGEVLAVIVTSGEWATGDAAGYIILFNVTTGFVNNENLLVSGGIVAVANGVESKRGMLASSAYDDIYYINAIEATRADIEEVPGSGDVIGVWQYKGVKYAFRNNALGTATVMFKESSSGWTECDLGERMSYDTGSVAFIEGETITKGAVSAVVRRVVLQSGTWGDGDAVGYFTISDRAGGDFSAGAATGSVSGAANIVGIQTENAFAVPSGRFEFVNTNYGGHTSTARMYGCDGKNKAFEWDGTYLTFIETGMVNDTPFHITSHKNHLFLMFMGGSVQHSSIVDPFTWSAVTGASELGMGDEGVGFLPLLDVLVIFTRNTTRVLYGSSISDWDLKPFADESGAVEWTIQKIGSGVFLDDRGLTSLSASQDYGDFKTKLLSEYIDPFLSTKILDVQCSIRVKNKNQYRLFFNDKQAITVSFNGVKVAGITRQLYRIQAICCCSSENLNGVEELFIGASDGFVYQFDSGNSFNGERLSAVAVFHYNSLKKPNTKKRIKQLQMEITTPKNTHIQSNIDFDFGENADTFKIANLVGNAGMWGISTWGEFVWGGRGSRSLIFTVHKTCLNFSLIIYCSGLFENRENDIVPRSGITNANPHILQGYIVNYDIRGNQR